MARWTLGELARAAHADLRGGALPEGVEAVGTDTRSLPPAALFVALRGPRFDGHAFAAAAVDAGARALLVDQVGVEQTGAASVPQLVVEDTLVALGDIAAHARRQLDKPVIAVTGSNGKTTTKELIAGALGSRGVVHKTRGNLNNLIGLPLTLLDWADDAWAAVVEMGMNAFGEIARLTAIAAPDVGVITNVAAAHIEGLGSIEGVARAKAELYEGLSASAVAVVNADDPWILSHGLPRVRGRVVRFGRGVDAEVRILGAEPLEAGLQVRLDIAGNQVDTKLGLIGTHNAYNAAAAAAAAHALGIDAEAIGQGLAEVDVPGGRLRLCRGHNGCSIVDDTYNANPGSMEVAFASLVERASGRSIAVLGDMRELGAEAAAMHRQVGESAARAGVALVLAVGEHAQDVVDGVIRGGGHGEAFDSLEALQSKLDGELQPSDAVLVKGSRGARMERVVRHLVGGEG